MRRVCFMWVLAGFCMMLGSSARGLQVPAIFSDHMVLQRDIPVAVWGKADPGAVIAVRFAGEETQAVADAQGDWLMRLSAMEASSQPRQLVVFVKSRSVDAPPEPNLPGVAFQDVLVGEVWHCAGQSNMEWPVRRSDGAEAELAAADAPLIRHFTPNRAASHEPLFSTGGAWQVTTPDSIKDFSAAGYFFAREVQPVLGVPIGLIDTSRGGAKAETYISYETLLTYEPYREATLAQREADLNPVPVIPPDPAEANKPEVHPDPDPQQQDLAQGLASAEFDDAGWHVAAMPATFARLGLTQADGVAWFRKTVPLPQAMRGQTLELSLGAVDDFDRTYINGSLVGSTDGSTPNWPTYPRRYTVPAELTDAESLTIAVRVFDQKGDGGFAGDERNLLLQSKDNTSQSISLAGDWRWRMTHRLSPDTLRDIRPIIQEQHKPYRMFYGTIHPVAPYTHRGVLWYQGEGNAARAADYPALMHLMLEEWRNLWDQPGEARDFPFLMVQLAHFRQPQDSPPAYDYWGELRLKQQEIADADEHTWLTTAIDIGDANDIHPTNKKTVGQRLAQLALRHVYGRQDIQPHGPTFKSLQANPSKQVEVIIALDHAEGLRTTDGQAPRGFAIRPADDADAPWRWTQAELRPDGTVSLALPDGWTGPVEVRYAYQINPTDGPHGINLVNAQGLPAMPFEARPQPASP